MGKDDHSDLSKTTFHEQKYVCHDIQLEKNYQQHDYSFKNFNDYNFDLLVIPELPVIVIFIKRQAIPLSSCRGGPPLLTQYLRGPPLI